MYSWLHPGHGYSEFQTLKKKKKILIWNIQSKFEIITIYILQVPKFEASAIKQKCCSR